MLINKYIPACVYKGGVDFLLHMLSNITDLPVTKSIVKDSGMGKAVGAIEKKSICAGTPNESAIKSRVQAIKSAWNKSVKARKEETTAPADSEIDSSTSKDRTVGTTKRSLPPTTTHVPKKAKVGDGKASKSSSSLSNLLRRVAPGDSSSNGDSANKSSSKKKRSVKWADHFGSKLSMIKLIGSISDENNLSDELHTEPTAGFLDRTKRDRHREKELLAKVK
jgi:TFIIS helical bundle-like domain